MNRPSHHRLVSGQQRRSGADAVGPSGRGVVAVPRTGARPRRVLPALTILVLVVLGALGSGIPAQAEDATPGKLLLMLDASGSMNGPDPSGTTKLVAAKKALTSVVAGLPDTSVVGLRVYGATINVPKPTAASCADTQLVAPVAPLDRAALTRAISRFTAVGDTPIAASLTAGVSDLGSTGKRNIVLVSDGEETCVPDPCPAVKALVAAGVDLQIDTVGFGVDAKARSQLQCIAAAGNGTYYDAKDAAGLTASLGKLSQRALRPFTVSGTPIVASPDAATAPTMTAGQYTDSFTSGAAPRSYKVTRSAGSTVRLSVTLRPLAGSKSVLGEILKITVTTPSGVACGSESAVRTNGIGAYTTLVAAVTVRGPDGATDTDSCHTATELLVAVQRIEGVSGSQPVEVLYIEEPAVTDMDSLPGPVAAATVTPLVAPAGATSARIVGGGSFSSALSLAPGTFIDTILPNEQIFYRVRLEDGQRAAFTVDVPTPGTTLSLGDFSSTTFRVATYAPDRQQLNLVTSEPPNTGILGRTSQSVVIGGWTAPVRYRNRAADATTTGYGFVDLRRTALAGYYYFAINRTAQTAGTDSAAPLDVRIRVAVEGQPSGAPAYVDTVSGLPTDPTTSSTTGSTTGSTTAPVVATSEPTSGGAQPALLAGAVAVVVLAAGAGVWGVVRRRRSGAEPR